MAIALSSDCASLLNEHDQTSEINHDTQRIGWEDINVSHLLGKGAFSDVFLVAVKLENEKPYQCALKCLNAERANSAMDSFVTAAADLAIEAKYLSKLNHKNILKLRAVSNTSLSKAYTEESSKGFFLLTEVLEETLHDRIQRWKKDASSEKGLLPKMFSNRKVRAIKLMSQMRNRIDTVAMDIASAMKYLHSTGVVLRDLKPKNVGFDSECNVQLFDFGMARHVDECIEGEVAGTFRYMAPEIMQQQKSSFSSDVYSFGVLLWEICTCRVPFEDMKKTDVESFIREVSQHHARPSLKKIPCQKTRALVWECWNPDSSKRPHFDQICDRLRSILDEPIDKSHTEKPISTTTEVSLDWSCKSL